jgi:hypothetical protein
MNKILICMFAVLLGFAFLAHRQEWLIINWPAPPSEQATTAARTEKRTVKLYFWSQDRWKHEAVEILWSDDKAQSAKYLVDAWLTWLEEEGVDKDKVSLQAALLSPSGQELIVSFDRVPFTEEQSTFEKWHWIESLLKTIRDNAIKLQQVRFLVHHQPIEDYHLDLGRAWPLIGFK